MLGRCSSSNVSGLIHTSDIKSRIKIIKEKNQKSFYFQAKNKEALPIFRCELNKMTALVKNNKHNPDKQKLIAKLDLELHMLERRFANRTNNKPAEYLNIISIPDH